MKPDYDAGPAEEPMKKLEDVFSADPRNSHIQLEKWYVRLERIQLSSATPRTVKQLFENARTVALYTYYAYRLHQTVEILAYITLESALKMKYELSAPNLPAHRKPRTLKDFMDIALEHGWIRDEGFSGARELAEHRVQMRQAEEMINRGVVATESVKVPEPTEEQVIEEMRSMQLARQFTRGSRNLRNHLVHGGRGLWPGGFAALTRVAAGINQLFPEP